MEITKQVEDKRGKIIFCANKDDRFNIVELKKGFSRGGHYHSFKSVHLLIVGKINIREKKIDSSNEKICTYQAPAIISIAEYTAHLFTAIKDSIFVELFENEYDAINFPKYRQIVEKSF